MDKMTEAALKKVKQENGVQEVQEKEVQTKKKPTTVKETTETTETTEVKKSDNTVVLGKNKSVKIKPWTGKTKKKIRKIFENIENPEDIDFIAVIKILIYDYIEDDIYLNEGEQQYILTKIREISLGEDINVSTECPECYALNNINTTLSNIVHYKDNELPHKYNDDIELVDIDTLATLENAFEETINSEDYDGITTINDIESALHIKIKDKSLKEVIDYLDNSPIKETEKVFELLNELLPKCELSHTKVCKNCKKEITFPIEITESIFESLVQ